MSIIDLTGDSPTSSVRPPNAPGRSRRRPRSPASNAANAPGPSRRRARSRSPARSQDSDALFFDDPLTFERAAKANGVQLNKQWYAKSPLREWVRQRGQGAFVPHSRRPLTHAERALIFEGPSTANAGNVLHIRRTLPSGRHEHFVVRRNDAVPGALAIDAAGVGCQELGRHGTYAVNRFAGCLLVQRPQTVHFSADGRHWTLVRYRDPWAPPGPAGVIDRWRSGAGILHSSHFVAALRSQVPGNVSHLVPVA